MSIFKDVTKTVKNIFSADDDMMFEEDGDFEVENKNPFFSKPGDKKKIQNAKPLTPTFDLDSHGFGMAKANQNAAKRSNGKIQIYVPKTFEEAFNIIRDVKAGFTAMVNVEVANPQISQRLIDVVSGAIFALDGDCKKMGEKQYIFSLSTETIGAYDYLPVNGGDVQTQAPTGFNFNMAPSFDYGMQQPVQNQQAPAFNPGTAPSSFGQTNFPQGNFNQSNYNQNSFSQNAERASQDLQSFHVPPKSQF